MYLLLDERKRIVASSEDCAFRPGPGQTALAMNMPEGWDAERLNDWRVADGELVHDPLPETEPLPNRLDDLTAVTVDHEYRLILMEMGVTENDLPTV